MQRRASIITLLILAACGGREFTPGHQTVGPDEATGAHTLQTTAERSAVLALVNDSAVDFVLLDETVGLDRRAARGIIDHRDGPDGVARTSDDDLFDSIDELDAVKYVGKSALQRLLDYAVANGYLKPATHDRDATILAVVNDTEVDQGKLDNEVGLDRRAATNIVAHRDGADGVAGTADDDLFDTLEELDAIKYVGPTALERIYQWALANGYATDGAAPKATALFSPAAYANSHNQRVAALIRGARRSIDIAMYSYSDAAVGREIASAVQRGVKVRFIFETANADRKQAEADRGSTRSGRLEAAGVNVRWVNKIMHHKFMIVDGPRDDLSHAATAKLVTGSANWSYGAVTRYDENTLFLSQVPELTLRFQREFDLMWAHSRDFVHDASLPFELSTAAIAADALETDPTVDAYFTSANFTVRGDTFRIATGRNEISDAMVAAIESATDSIDIASGHLRSRPISEALMTKAMVSPEVSIRVYLDGQEYISAWYDGEQARKRDRCLVAAGDSASRQRACNERGFYFGYRLDRAGIDVRYKYYAYRWEYSYALQMHHKFMIVDGDELWTGSYNLSDNAEHNTFENMVVLRGPSHAQVIASYQANFDALWSTERDTSRYADLVATVQTATQVPIVFAPMALSWQEITDLKLAIRTACPAVTSELYRREAARFRFCTDD